MRNKTNKIYHKEGISMPATKALYTLKERTNWHVARKLLKLSGLPASVGWENTAQALKKENINENFPKFLKIVKELNVCGEKQITMYDIGKDITTLRKAALSAEIEDNELSQSYPYSVRYEDLSKKQMFIEPSLIAREKLTAGTALIYSSYRIIRERIEISPKALGGEYKKYSEIYAINRQYKQAFDIVWIPNSGTTIDLRLDTLLAPNVNQLISAKAEIIKCVKKDFQISLKNPVNIFEQINALYKNSTEGMVLELGFDTSTASRKLEKMRRVKDAPCLRKETYHVGGKEKLSTDITPFHILLRWDRERSPECVSLPELMISANTTQMNSSTPIANDYVINKCIDLEDFNFIQSKLLKK